MDYLSVELKRPFLNETLIPRLRASTQIKSRNGRFINPQISYIYREWIESSLGGYIFMKDREYQYGLFGGNRSDSSLYILYICHGYRSWRGLF